MRNELMSQVQDLETNSLVFLTLPPQVVVEGTYDSSLDSSMVGELQVPFQPFVTDAHACLKKALRMINHPEEFATRVRQHSHSHFGRNHECRLVIMKRGIPTHEFQISRTLVRFCLLVKSTKLFVSCSQAQISDLPLQLSK